MKIHLKDNKIALYDIESDYRQYLFQYDFRVNLKSGRRFVGIIVGIEDYTYFISLTSKPLRKNGKRTKTFELTDTGKQILKLKYKARQLAFAKLILSHKVFYLTIQKYFENVDMPEPSEIVKFMKECNLYKIGSDSTYYRRASTIKAWIDWIINLITE